MASILSCSLILGPVERATADAGDFAAGALIGGLIGGVLSQGGGKTRRRTGTQRTTLPSTQDGREIQTSLNYFGFNVGRVDGQLGRKSKEAISQYQAYLGYPVSGQLSPYGQELLVSSYQRALASGYMATQQAMSHPDGQRGLLKIYLAERRVPQPNFPQQQNQPQYNQAGTMMVNGAVDAYGQQQYAQPQAAFSNQNVNAYGAQQQYGQAGQQPVYGAAIQPNVQTFGAQQQFAPQQQQQFVPQQQFAAQPQQVQPQYAPQQQPVPQQFATQSGAVTAQLDAATTVLQASAPTQQTQSLATLANRRWALVVGVDGYENLEDLKKARNDAQAVSQALTRLGFEVRTLYDPSRRDMNSAVSTMANQIDPGDEVLFYFAGHGVEVEGRNFLLPSDVPMINLGDESYLTGESIAADRVLDTFQKRGARTTVMILDACRNNPFPSDGKRSVGGARGLVRMSPPEGAFILYSAGAGQTALDRLSDTDGDPNSVFTRALLPRLNDPSMSLHQLAKQVRRDVQDLASTVNHDQFPAYYDQMSGDLFLARTSAASQ
ncbi:peptidase C14 [Parasedimentitalea marina]|uniref:Peptidase C14 n=2 Tax=Parasedimentitalea marina TaxID=2483033 RepID=A0A3T0N5Q3_9RHOB|nr:peptidase C14 [Parasedimentitalea marina]